jgi:hypothetical protein
MWAACQFLGIWSLATNKGIKMKIRTGFVTNSSSTSYTIIVEQGYCDEIIKSLHPYVQAVCKAVIDAKPMDLFDRKVYVINYTTGNGSTFEWLDVDYNGEMPEGEYDEHMRPSEAFEEFTRNLKDKSKFLRTSIDC